LENWEGSGIAKMEERLKGKREAVIQQNGF
jgi:hypothetical protein